MGVGLGYDGGWGSQAPLSLPITTATPFLENQFPTKSDNPFSFYQNIYFISTMMNSKCKDMRMDV